VTWSQFLPTDLIENSVAIKEAVVKKRKSVTLTNLTTHRVSLASWKLHNSAGQAQELPGNAVLNPMSTGGFEVPKLHLSSNGDIITLVNEAGLKVDGVSYNSQQGNMEGRPIVFAH
jgi:P pilus assembly chaperone PapD